MSYFFSQLIAPRANFAREQSDAEMAIMAEHVRYMHERFAAGEVVLFGPVLAAEGAFGCAILDVADEAAARRLFDDDPSVKAGIMTLRLAPMHVGAARAL